MNSKSNNNFLPQQYETTGAYPINHNYLQHQFSDYKEIFEELEKLVLRGDYTLGRAVDDFESKIIEITGAKHALGVGSGTDALMLSLIAGGITKGDEVITTPYTFYATIGAIVTAGATPVFVDVKEDYNIDPSKIEQAITSKTKAILPVHWSGCICDMNEIMEIANQHNLFVVEDACHAIQATYYDKPAGRFGLTGCFSLHPLKNLNVWGDGGYLVTDSSEIYEKLSLMRNHGLINRDECAMFAYNSRLDTLQAIVANHLLKKIDHITMKRIEHANYFDDLLSDIPQVTIPYRNPNIKQVYHLYIIRVPQRDELQKYLQSHGVDAKVHYPIPMHLQPAAKHLGYQRGDFPVCEEICDTVLSLPVHEFITTEDVENVAKLIKNFF